MDLQGLITTKLRYFYRMESDVEVAAAQLRPLAQQACDFAKKLVLMGGRDRWTFERGPNGRVRSYGRSQDPSAKLQLESLAKLVGYPALFETLERSQHTMKLVASMIQSEDEDYARRTGVGMVIHDLVRDIVDVDTWTVSEALFASADIRLRAIMSGNSVHHALAFLDEVAVTEPLELDGITLRAPAHWELLEVFNLGGLGNRHEPAMNCGAVLESSEQTSSTTPMVIDARIDAAITALNVWTTAPISSIATYSATNKNALRGQIRLPNKRWHSVEPPPLLNDPVGFAAFYRRTRDVFARPFNSLAVALRRLKMMVENERNADLVLDLYIILEALFQRGDEKQELAYRLSLRTAHFLGGDFAKRRATNKAIKAGYSVRSKIAHGSAIDSSDESAQAAVERIVYEVLLKYCIQAAAAGTQDPHAAIIEEIDGFLLERRGDT